MAGRLSELEKEGCHVKFWQVPREWNAVDKYAKEAVLASN